LLVDPASHQGLPLSLFWTPALLTAFSLLIERWSPPRSQEATTDSLQVHPMVSGDAGRVSAMDLSKGV